MASFSPIKDLEVIAGPPDAVYKIAKLTGPFTLGVYSDGRVWDFINGSWLTTWIDKDGYEYSTRGKLKFSIHRLVLSVWDRFPSRGEQTRHLDGNPENNNITNLVWGSGKQNWSDRKLHGRGMDGELHHNAKLTEVKVKDILRRINQGESLRSIAREYNVGVNTIGNIKRKRTWKYVTI